MTDRELLDRKGHEVNDELPPLPDQYDAAAHMYPWDIEDFQTGEKTGVVFSIPVGCPDGKSVPLWTSEQMRAYARAAVLAERERCAEECDKIGERHRKMNDSRPPELMTSGENAAYECADAIRKDAP